MDIDYLNCEDYDLRNPFDRIRLDEDRKQRAIEIGKARRARDKTYLKGQHGKRKYVDYSITHETKYNDIDPYLRDDDNDWDHIDVFMIELNAFSQEICVEKSYINF